MKKIKNAFIISGVFVSTLLWAWIFYMELKFGSFIGVEPNRTILWIELVLAMTLIILFLINIKKIWKGLQND